MTKEESFKRVLTGKIVSDKMDKTIVVETVRQVRHRLYKKYIKISKKFKAHDETNTGRTGDTVTIVESRPISKTKTWVLGDVVERSQ